MSRNEDGQGGAAGGHSLTATYDVFLSYARSDRAHVRRIADALRVKFRVFVDDSLLESSSITKGIVEALAGSRVLLAWYSRDYAVRPACLEELLSAYRCALTQSEPPHMRILVINPEAGVAHIMPAAVRDARHFLRPESPGDLAQLVCALGNHLSSVLSPLASDGRLPSMRPKWYGDRRESGPRFCGRVTELLEILDAATAHSAIATSQGPDRRHPRRVVIRGLSGGGKTHLIVEFAHRFGSQFPGGVFWLDGGADGGADPADSPSNRRTRAFRRILGDMGIVLDGAGEQAVREEIAEKVAAITEPILWVVDGVPSGWTEAELREWCAPARDGFVVITTVSTGYRNMGGAVSVGPLALADAVKLLSCHVAARGQSLDEDACREIARRVGGVPILVDMAGFAANGDYRRLASAWAASGFEVADVRQLERSLELGADMELPTGHSGLLMPGLCDALEAVPEGGNRCLGILALLGSVPAPRDMVVSIVCAGVDGVVEQELGRSIDSLAECGLIDVVSIGRNRLAFLRVHPVVRVLLPRPASPVIVSLVNAMSGHIVARLEATGDGAGVVETKDGYADVGWQIASHYPSLAPDSLIRSLVECRPSSKSVAILSERQTEIEHQSGADSERAVSWRVLLAKHLWYAGRKEESRAILDAVVVMASSRGVSGSSCYAEALDCQATELIEENRLDVATERLRCALQALSSILPEGAPRVTRARLRLAHVLVLAHQDEEAKALLDMILVGPELSGATEVGARSELMFLAIQRRDAEAARPHLDRIQVLQAKFYGSDHPALFDTVLAGGLVAVLEGDPKAEVGSARLALQIAVRHYGSGSLQARMAHAVLCTMLASKGWQEDAAVQKQALLEDIVGDGREFGMARAWAWDQLVRILVSRGDHEHAIRRARSFVEFAATTDVQGLEPAARLCRALALFSAGEIAEARIDTDWILAHLHSGSDRRILQFSRSAAYELAYDVARADPLSGIRSGELLHKAIAAVPSGSWDLVRRLKMRDLARRIDEKRGRLSQMDARAFRKDALDLDPKAFLAVMMEAAEWRMEERLSAPAAVAILQRAEESLDSRNPLVSSMALDMVTAYFDARGPASECTHLDTKEETDMMSVFSRYLLWLVPGQSDHDQELLGHMKGEHVRLMMPAGLLRLKLAKRTQEWGLGGAEGGRPGAFLGYAIQAVLLLAGVVWIVVKCMG